MHTQLDRIERRQAATLRHLNAVMILLIEVLKQTPPPPADDPETVAKLNALNARVAALTAEAKAAIADAPDLESTVPTPSKRT